MTVLMCCLFGSLQKPVRANTFHSLTVASAEALDEMKMNLRMSITDEACGGYGSEHAPSGERIRLPQIGEKIVEYTNKTAGKGNKIIDRPILLTVYRRDMVDLTMIDLPGLIRDVIKEADRHVPGVSVRATCDTCA